MWHDCLRNIRTSGSCLVWILKAGRCRGATHMLRARIRWSTIWRVWAWLRAWRVWAWRDRRRPEYCLETEAATCFFFGVRPIHHIWPQKNHTLLNSHYSESQMHIVLIYKYVSLANVGRNKTEGTLKVNKRANSRFIYVSDHISMRNLRTDTVSHSVQLFFPECSFAVFVRSFINFPTERFLFTRYGTDFDKSR